MSRHEAELGIRSATVDDLAVLWDFMAIAAYEADVAAAKAVPFVAGHLAGWKRAGDFGFIVERNGRVGGTSFGMIWARPR